MCKYYEGYPGVQNPILCFTQADRRKKCLPFFFIAELVNSIREILEILYLLLVENQTPLLPLSLYFVPRQ